MKELKIKWNNVFNPFMLFLFHFCPFYENKINFLYTFFLFIPSTVFTVMVQTSSTSTRRLTGKKNCKLKFLKSLRRENIVIRIFLYPFSNFSQRLRKYMKTKAWNRVINWQTIFTTSFKKKIKKKRNNLVVRNLLLSIYIKFEF